MEHAPLPITKAHATDFVELSLNRQHWSHADYYAEAIRQCEAGETHRPIPQHLRAEYAEAFCRMTMPAAKYAEHQAQKRAAIYAEFGAPPVDQRAFTLGRVS